MILDSDGLTAFTENILLDYGVNPITFTRMKSLVKWMTVLGLVVSLSSCGLPGAVVRTATNTVKSAVNMAKGAASSASAL